MSAPDFADIEDGPADGCTGSPWCECWDCDRIPTPVRTYDLDYELEAPF